jgi:hypothetical protein
VSEGGSVLHSSGVCNHISKLGAVAVALSPHQEAAKKMAPNYTHILLRGQTMRRDFWHSCTHPSHVRSEASGGVQYTHMSWDNGTVERD